MKKERSVTKSRVCTCILISSLVAFSGGGQCHNLSEITRKCHQALVFFSGLQACKADFMR